MRLLVINFEMSADAAVLAWQERVVEKLAARCDAVHVLTEKAGRTGVPDNVHVEEIRFNVGGRFYQRRAWLHANLELAWKCRRRKIDACFIHMAHPWAYRYRPCFRWLGIPVLLWYAHGTIGPDLRRALDAVDRVVTSTPEGFRIPSDKVYVIGQGIDLERYPLVEFGRDRNALIYSGRISRRKRIHLLVGILGQLVARRPEVPWKLKIMGTPLWGDDHVYQEELFDQMREAGLHERIEWLGHVPQDEQHRHYRDVFLHINTSATGSMDKTVLEALAMGCPVLTTNKAFRDLLACWPGSWSESEGPGDLAEKVLRMREGVDDHAPEERRAVVEASHSLDGYVARVWDHLNALRGNG